MNKIWEYRGREYPFDVTSDRCSFAVSHGLEELRSALEGDGEHPSVCGVIGRFFDTIFGVGAGKLVCGENDSAEEHISAYISFIGFLCAQVDDFSRIREELVARV